MGKSSGDQVRLDLTANELIEPNGRHRLRTVRRAQFDGACISLSAANPRVGRFYPKGVLKDLTNIFKGNQEPFRVVEANDGV